jgi:hypothetical protein
VNDQSNIGLFRYTNGATIQNIGVLGSVVGIDNVALLIGDAENTIILNSYASGTVSANYYV